MKKPYSGSGKNSIVDLWIQWDILLDLAILKCVRINNKQERQ